MDQKHTLFPVPLFLWQALEASLKHEARRLVKDISATLQTNEADLWKQVNKEVFSAYLVEITEPTDEKFTCISYEATGSLYKPCGKPVIFGEKVCPDHKGHCLTKPPSHLTKYRILNYYDDEISDVVKLYLNQATNEVVHPESLEVVGSWDTQENQLTLFEKEE